MSSLQELMFPLEYYSDEIREGFFVSETMKRYWAAQLVVLSDIDTICKRHDINWYADSGTMLGAVRHKGYIPWDDDLDIGMFREDYKRFLTYARKELSKETAALRNFYLTKSKMQSKKPLKANHGPMISEFLIAYCKVSFLKKN